MDTKEHWIMLHQVRYATKEIDDAGHRTRNLLDVIEILLTEIDDQAKEIEKMKRKNNQRYTITIEQLADMLSEQYRDSG